MRNLCHFDIQIGDVLYPAAERPLVLEPILGPLELTTQGVPFRVLYGFQVPDHLLDMSAGEDRRVVVPRLAPAIALARDAGLEPYTIPLSLIGDRGRPGPVVLESEDQLEPAPSWLVYDYSTAHNAGCLSGEISRHVKGRFPIRVSDGPTLAPVPDDQAAVDHPDGSATCPREPDHAWMVLVPHSGPIIREYASRGLVVFVTSTVKPDGTVDLYRVA